MFFLEEPYISPLLADFAADSGVPVFDTPFARRNLAGRKINFTTVPDAGPHYANSESALQFVTKERFGAALPEKIALLKDKAAFREALRPLFPAFRFTRISLSELLRQDPASLPYPFVLKPSVGFLSIGVYMVRTPQDFADARKALLAGKGKTGFAKTVVDESTFLMETLLDGPEFAVDAYYDKNGTPVILDIFSHPFASAADVRDRIYITSAEIIARYYERVRKIFVQTGEIFGLRDFPLHCEFRDVASGIVPIEFNPFRFAGWCTTELAWFAWHFLPYEALVNQHVPEFPVPQKNSKTYYFTLAERVAGMEAKQFDYDAYTAALPGCLDCRRFDPHRHPISAIAFGAANSDAEIRRVLNLDLASFYRE